VERECNATLEEVREVVKSVSAAVPAPAHLTTLANAVRERGRLCVPYVWSNVVDLFTVFVGDNGACSGSCVGSKDDSVLELDADYGGSCGGVSRLLESIAG
jgi:hypothetical protein